jgi:hypothetical protein
LGCVVMRCPTWVEMQSLANNGVSTVLILIRHRFPAGGFAILRGTSLALSKPDRSR